MIGLESVMITGASRGIGRSVAIALAQRHRKPLKLCLVARDLEALNGVAEEARQASPHSDTLEVRVARMDAADPASVAEAVHQSEAALGSLEGLVLAAGIAESAPLHRTDDAMFERLMAVNLGGVFRAMREALPGMRRRGKGRVVILGSIASQSGAPYISAYCASKHAVLGLARAAALEVAGQGITVNVVCPGYVDTPMTENTLRNIREKTGLSKEQALEKILEDVPQGRLFSPEEVAASVLFLLSDEAAGVTGSTLNVDGGQLAQ